MFRVVVSDLDGTLLSSDHRITSFTKKILKLLIEKGIHFVFATGRHHMDVETIRKNLGINSYMITSNGARIHNVDGKLIFSHNIDEDIAAELFNLVYKDQKIFTNAFRNDEWFINRNWIDQKKFLSRINF